MFEEESDVQDQMTRLVKKVTLWEFLKMKVERSNGGLRIPEMLSEFESLYDQIRRVTKERLEPVGVDDTSEQPGLKPDAIMVVSGDRIFCIVMHLLCILHYAFLSTFEACNSKNTITSGLFSLWVIPYQHSQRSHFRVDDTRSVIVG